MRDQRELLDVAALAAIGDLHLAARIAVDGFLMGSHNSRSTGAGTEFHQNRPYVMGDDIRNLDWKILARQDRLVVREYREESSTAVYLLLDASASMDFKGTRARLSKWRYAQVCAACLAELARRQGDTPACLTYSERVIESVPPRRSRANFDRLLHALHRTQPAGTADHAAAFRHLAGQLRRRCIVIVITDGLDDGGALLPTLSGLASRGNDVALLHVLDPDEMELPGEGPTWFVDSESGQRRQSDPEAVRPQYRQAFGAWCRQVERDALSLGLRHQVLQTDTPVSEVLAAFLNPNRGTH